MGKAITKTVPEPSDQSAVSHELNRAAFRLPLMQARVLQVLISQLRPADTEFPTVEMTVGDILRSLELEDRPFYREEIRAAAKGLMGQVIDAGDWDTGWVQFHLLEKARYVKARDCLQMRLSEEISDFALDLKGLFSMVTNEEFARLTSEYAIRIFQLVSSWKDKAGKDGNKPGCWYWDTDFDTLRHLMKVPPGAYRGRDGTSNFKSRVIDNPVKEINGADLGFTIKPVYRKRSRSIVGVRFDCKLTKKKTSEKTVEDPKKAPQKAASASHDDGLSARSSKIEGEFEAAKRELSDLELRLTTDQKAQIEAEFSALTEKQPALFPDARAAVELGMRLKLVRKTLGIE